MRFRLWHCGTFVRRWHRKALVVDLKFLLLWRQAWNFSNRTSHELARPGSSACNRPSSALRIGPGGMGSRTRRLARDARRSVPNVFSRRPILPTVKPRLSVAIGLAALTRALGRIRRPEPVLHGGSVLPNRGKLDVHHARICPGPRGQQRHVHVVAPIRGNIRHHVFC